MRNIRCFLVVAVLVFAAHTSLVWAQSNSKEIMARPAEQLVEILKNPAASVFEKAKACQRLAVLGTKDAVPALAALLPDEKLNCYARCGLEGIADPAAAAALRDATATLKGRQLVGVIDSMGQRKDAQAVELLRGLLENKDTAVAAAAAGALGRIGSTESAEALKIAIGKNSSISTWVADGCLACADRLVSDGKTDEAIALDEAVAKAGVPKHVKTAAILGQSRLDPTKAKDILLSQLRNQDKVFFNLGLVVARELPGADATVALGALLDKLPPDRQAALLRAIGDRKERAPLLLFVTASKSASPVVREAAIRVLARSGDVAAAAVLLDAALGDADVAKVAKEGLADFKSVDVDAAIVARLTGADPKMKIALFELLGVRRIVTALPNVREAMKDSNESIRFAAIAALGQLVDLKDLDLLTSAALAGGDPKDVAAARAALKVAAMRMGDREACAAKLAECLKGTSVANQAYLLDLLGNIDGKTALATVVANVKSNDQTIKDAATRVLGEWPSAEAAPALLDIVKNDADSKYQIRALRGYIRIARQLKLSTETKFAMYSTAMSVARRDQEKQIALDILTRIPSLKALKLAVSCLDKPALKNQAADAAVAIATKLVSRDPKAVGAAMKQIVDAKVTGDAGGRAQQLLEQAKAGSK